jgi:aminopeptidase C
MTHLRYVFLGKDWKKSSIMFSLTKSYFFRTLQLFIILLTAFYLKVEEVKPMTHQKSSGRCWIFAVLNAVRIPFVKQYNVEEFEFSQAHLFFWDKVIFK